MTFRVTPHVFLAQSLASARNHTTNLADLQRQISSGLRVEKPSDDPLAMPGLLSLKATDARLTADLNNIPEVRAQLNVGVTHLLEINGLLVQARDIALQGNQTFDATEREAIAKEVDSLIDQVLALSNSQYEGRYLFAGTSSEHAPFVVSQANSEGQPESINYQGTADRAEAIFGSGLEVDTRYDGSEVFQARAREDTILIGSTGAASGSGTDSAVGQGSLVVRHTVTNYAAGSGVLPGASSATGDTIIGPPGSHVLTIVDTSGTGAAGTVSLNGGSEVAFTSADTDLLVAGPGGDVVYLDMSGIAAGFNGTVSAKGDGTLSVDGGVTEIAIDFSSNQVVTDSATGDVTNIDSSNIRRAGTDQLEYVGTADVFQSLIALRDQLRSTAVGPDAAWHDAMARRLTDLDRAGDSVLDAVAEQSVALENLDALEGRTRDMQLETRRVISDIESVDIAEVVIELQNTESMLQFTFAATVALMDQSLLDFIA